jgi:hypothetical protein
MKIYTSLFLSANFNRVLVFYDLHCYIYYSLIYSFKCKPFEKFY